MSTSKLWLRVLNLLLMQVQISDRKLIQLVVLFVFKYLRVLVLIKKFRGAF